MEIKLSQYAGFCSGVKRAYDMVSVLDPEKSKKPVFILGSLVHNDEVNKKIEEKGIKKIDEEFLSGAKSGEIGTLIITAHGVSPDIYETAKQKGIVVFDTTCPKVIKVQRLAMTYAKRGYEIIIIGDKDHKEVRGINGWGGGKSEIISIKKDLNKLKFNKNEKIVILSQTTQNEDFFLEIGESIRKKYEKAEIINTTCHATHERQEEVKKLARNNEAVIIIGSKTSANSNRLWEISRNINPLSYFIEKASDLKAEWLKDVKSVGVAAGASTPEWIINEAIKKLATS
jgi:(E)-4-hydroxy-3-methyl-but-2-enyl pyrophosphate reductase